MLTYTIQPFRVNADGNEIDILAHVNTVVSDLETAQKEIVRAVAADGVRIMAGEQIVWHRPTAGATSHWTVIDSAFHARAQRPRQCGRPVRRLSPKIASLDLVAVQRERALEFAAAIGRRAISTRAAFASIGAIGPAADSRSTSAD